ncbi:MAG: epoxyqueuosine reductase [Solirubrobacterales bacterium]
MKKNINDLVKGFVKEYKHPEGSKTGWRDPITGFAAADDPLFLKLKDIVSPDHNLPTDVLPSAETVISYFIPFANSLVKTNKEGDNCSLEWSIAYTETNKMLSELGQYLVSKIREMGYEAEVAGWKFDREKLISNWSQRHVAYIAGLGTFGINNMLITDKGCGGRFGSIVTNMKIEPDKRPEIENCLFKSSGKCEMCIKKCVAGALKADSFDRKKCYEKCLENAELYKEYGNAEACGKCMTMVPCTFINPAKGGC